MRPCTLAPILAALAAAAFTLSAGSARAEGEETESDWMNKKSRLRDGVVLGGSLQGGLAGASGYPNDPKAIDNPDFYSASNLMYGFVVTPTLMGALTDWLNFGFMANIANHQSSNWESFGVGVGIRLEVFPLYTRMVSKAKNFGLFGQGGIGVSKLHAKAGGYPDADAAQSYLGAGAFYEWSLFSILGGHVAAGPIAQWDSVFSRDFERHGVNVGLRTVWYGGK